MYDILIKNTTIVDGSGEPAFKGDLAVSEGKIAKIAPVIEAEAMTVIDGKDLVTAPGFIETHTHSDSILLTGSDSYNMLEEGTTTQIAGQCGSSPAPYCERRLDGLKHLLSEEEFAECVKKAATPSSLINAGRSAALGTNIALFEGHRPLRQYAMDFRDSVPTREEMQCMKDMLTDAMEAGYLGLSTGLVYAPSVYAKTEELIELASVMQPYDGIYVSHIRDEGSRVLESVEEALRIGREAGVAVWISHLKVLGAKNEGLSVRLLELLENARANGQEVYADQYPYSGASAPLMSQIPPRFQTMGISKTLKSFEDAGVRAEIARAMFEETDIFESSVVHAGFEKSYISGARMTPQYINKSLAEIADMMGVSPVDAMCRLLIENDGTVQGNYINQNATDILRIMGAKNVFCGMDSSDRREHKPENTEGGAHPRGCGTMVRRLELERDFGLRTMEASLANITAAPAKALGLKNIGMLKEGWNADITIMDYEKLHATASYRFPYAKNQGIRYVIVNGQLALENGTANGVRAGKVLTRTSRTR